MHQHAEKFRRLLNIMVPEHVGRSLLNYVQLLPDGELSLQRQDSSIVETHENVSLCLVEVCNFALLSSALSARSLVRFLNEFVSIIDSLALKYSGLVKIRMITGSYLVAAGLHSSRHQRRRRIASDVKQLAALIEFALDVQQTIKRHRFRIDRQNNEKPSALFLSGSLSISVKIGIHYGDVVGGIIGKLRPVM
jgi:class 3 adenylate cyclase